MKRAGSVECLVGPLLARFNANPTLRWFRHHHYVCPILWTYLVCKKVGQTLVILWLCYCRVEFWNLTFLSQIRHVRYLISNPRKTDEIVRVNKANAHTHHATTNYRATCWPKMQSWKSCLMGGHALSFLRQQMNVGVCIRCLFINTL
jgi:hypothetical protein